MGVVRRMDETGAVEVQMRMWGKATDDDVKVYVYVYRICVCVYIYTYM